MCRRQFVQGVTFVIQGGEPKFAVLHSCYILINFSQKKNIFSTNTEITKLQKKITNLELNNKLLQNDLKLEK